MAKVILSASGAKDFSKQLEVFTQEDKLSLRYWISFVERKGIVAAQLNPSFRDHELIGKWKGYRAASFGFSSRIIYRVLKSEIEIVEIERITNSHNYER